jgi:hypothetical protein
MVPVDVLADSHPGGLPGSTAQQWIILIALLLIFGIILGRIWVLSRRRGAGPRVVVQCQAGHLFTTTWIPFMSIKAIRLGLVRFQFCPVGRHWSLVTIVRDEDLSDWQRKLADQYDDGGVP